MSVVIDISNLEKIARAAGKLKGEYGKTQLKGSMRKALTPMLRAVKSIVPVAYKNKKSTLGRDRFKRNTRDMAYDRGGATKRDTRKMVVDAVGKVSYGKDGAEVAGLVGTSQKRTKVGWRTKFITRGTKGGKDRKGRNRKEQAPNDYLGRAYMATKDQMMASVANDIDKKAAKLAALIKN